MSLYEHVLIVRQDVSSSQVETIADAMAAVIEQGGGQVKKRESWGLRNLTYKIKKNRKGHYVFFNVEAPSDAVLEMERQERIHEDVLRYLTVRVDALEEEPSAMLRQRGGRDDRGPRGRGRDDFREGRRPRGDRFPSSRPSRGEEQGEGGASAEAEREGGGA